jgi:RimJ/RimL family protein N-acetyltransferase
MTSAPIPILRSSRLTLRGLCEADRAPLLAMAHDAEVTRYLHEGPAPSAEEVSNRVARALRQWELRGYGMMGVEDDKGFIGRLGLFQPADAEEPLFVYAFARRGWGKGYATEGVGLFLNWMRAAHELQRVLCHIDPLNVASARVAARFDALRIGTTIRAGSELDVWSLPIPTRTQEH